MSGKMQNISAMFSPLAPLGIEVGTQLEMARGLRAAPDVVMEVQKMKTMGKVSQRGSPAPPNIHEDGGTVQCTHSQQQQRLARERGGK